FGILTKRRLKESLVPVVCLIVPLFCFILDKNSVSWLGGYAFGYELLIVNGFLTFVMLLLISQKRVL
ncbi:MAG: sodium:solute symporter, partial [Bacteroidota bacterium]